MTLAQHWTNIGSMHRVCWDVIAAGPPRGGGGGAVTSTSSDQLFTGHLHLSLPLYRDVMRKY